MEEKIGYVVVDDPDWTLADENFFGEYDEYPEAVDSANFYTQRDGQVFYVVEVKSRFVYRVEGKFTKEATVFDAT